MDDCKHEWKEEYYGIRCIKCDLFYPDNCNWFAPLDDDPAEDVFESDCEDDWFGE